MLKTIFTSLFALMLSCQASATVVEVRTNLGNITINLFDESTPETVQNFLDYVNSGAYVNNVVHRSETGFIIQAGGFQYNNELPFDNVPTGTPVTNEPELSNVRGTIAMAKVAGDPDSATSQWFINLANNSANLDVQNGGFTVFGQVIDGMLIVDDINALPRFNMGGATSAIPLMDYTSEDANNDVVPDESNFVLISDIVVTDPATVTNPDLNPAENTLIDNTGGDTTPPVSSPSSGGVMNPFLLAVFALFVLCFRRNRNV